MKEEIISKFEENFDEQNRKIDEFEGKIAIQANTIDQLIIKCDDNEQYSRRSCLRIHGIECSDDERNDNVLQRVKECYEEMNLPFQDENIDRVHRIGRAYTDKNTRKKSNPSSSSLILGNPADNFIMQDRSISTTVNGSKVNIYSVYRLISQEGDIYY